MERRRRQRATGIGIVCTVLVLGTAGCSGHAHTQPTAADRTTPAGAAEGTAGNTGPGRIPQPTHAQLVAAGLDKLPLAPLRDRVDLRAPVFSDPTHVTNPLFPVSELDSVVFSGHEGDQPFHTETTLLPYTRVIEWSPGQQVKTLVSQYMAYVGGRLLEVALDYYAQADDGSVWYLGETVQDYAGSGLPDTTEGTWLAGVDGPPEMIMPGHPQVGDVHRAENIPAVAFEEVTIKKLQQTVPGPMGPVHGAMVARELHDDGTFSDKIFAPGYGEFFTSDKGELEAMALAVSVDKIPRQLPSSLRRMHALALALLETGRRASWPQEMRYINRIGAAWSAAPRHDFPRLRAEMRRALRDLAAATRQRDRTRLDDAAVAVGRSSLDLMLPYRSQPAVDRDRFEVWARRVVVDAGAGRLGAVRGDIATLEWIQDRFAPTLSPADRTALAAHLGLIRQSVSGGDHDLSAATHEARLLRHVRHLPPVVAQD